jgi:uncharacterized protein with von Willebrand factor type A (vWA) domain
MRITADTDAESLASHVGADTHRVRLRQSESRRQRLQRNARIRSGNWGLEVRIEPDAPPAAVVPLEDGTELVVSGREVPQPVTDYPDREWDLLVQKALTMHEVGHLRYTDHDDFRRRLDDIPEPARGVAAQVWNAFEDGAVEAAIGERWPNYRRLLGQLRANLLDEAGPGIADPRRGGYVFPLAHAIVCGVLDATTYDSGTYERLLDPDDETMHFADDGDRDLFETEIRDRLESTVEAVLTEPDATERNRLVFTFLDDVLPVVDEARADGKAQLKARTGNAWGMPDDASLGESGEAEAETPAMQDAEFETLSGGGSLQFPDEGEGEGEGDGEGEQSPDDVGDLEDLDPEEGDEDVTETSERLERVLADEVRDQASESRESTDEQMFELDELQSAVEAIDAELEADGIVVPTDDVECDEDVYHKALDDSKRLARLLRNRFQKQRKRTLSRNLRRGRLDPSALHRSATGGKRLKMQRELPEENDHHCLFVIDRSGSMNGDTMATAERAMGMLVFALESVDVEVAVLELFDKQCRLAKPFSQPAQTVRNRLFNGKAQGGTPLADTLHIARERLKREQGKRFLFVVTDGTPSDPERYMDALDRCTMPVVGVNLNDETPAGMDCFHRQVTVHPETAELRKALRQLVQEVLFE